MKYNRCFFILLILILVSLSISTAFATPGTITENVTLNVPTRFSDINAAIFYLQDKIISPNAIVTIRVAVGTYNYSNQITINHSDGNQIQIIGDTTNPSLCTINFSNCSTGISITNGNKLGLINGLTLNGSGMSTYSCGIFVKANSTITCGPNMILNNFYIGLYSTSASSIIANYITVSNANYGFIATYLGSIDVNYGVANNCTYGYCSQFNSSLTASNSIANNCTYGFIAYYNSSIYANISSANSCTYPYSPNAKTSGNVNSYIWTSN